MNKLLCNFVSNSRRIILNESRCREAIASFDNKYGAISGASVKCRNDFTNFSRSHRRNSDENKHKVNYKCVLVAAPTFLAFFKKPESDDDTLTWLEKLLPPRIRVMFEKEDESPEGQLVMTLKRSIICIQQDQHKKAEQMIHLALRMAQQMQHEDGITLCYDIMANLALETEQFEKADKLFVAVLQRLLLKGIKESDIKVLHISLKIAQIAEYRSQPEKAELGYQWTLAELQKLVKSNSSDPDLYELWGLANDYYGKFLLQKRSFAEARNHLSTSYDVYTQIHGRNHPHVVDLLNNLAAVCTQLDDYGAAELYINDAIKLARSYPEMYQTGIYHANLGMLYLKKGLLPEARKSCSLARRMATESNSADGAEQANYCIDQINATMG